MFTSIFLISIGSWFSTTTPEIPWPEHPRPDFQRPAWLNLNGTWQFEFDPRDVGEKEQWYLPGGRTLAREIVVPFPWESRLSGIGDTGYQGVAWYARRVTLPEGEDWAGRDPWLIIGACDWECRLWVNGRPAGEHVGGYVPFEVNLAPYGRPGETLWLVIRAVDRTDPQQPTGKQVGWYTRTSGIWQTVYLEPRSKAFLRRFEAHPDVARGTIACRLKVSNSAGLSARVVSLDGAFPPADCARLPEFGYAVCTVRPERPETWSPEHPVLYPAAIEILDGPRTVDRVETYLALREISTAPAPGRDYRYVCLNGRPVYLRGALHQSFHPDGIYQYPDDATLRSDYELCKRIGLNMLRIHIKTPIPRELYWADRLGVLIMQDMPCFWRYSAQAREWFERMLPRVIQRDFNHPAVFAWVDFNETWGIGDGGYGPDRHAWVSSIYEYTRILDPTRPVEDNSPCNYDHVITDINSWHFYINDYDEARRHIREVVEKTRPGSPFNYVPGRVQDDDPLINSEYGGISAGLGDQDISWCFKYLTNDLRRHDKICGYVYTELSDIEWEHNGFVNYDRTPKEYGYDYWHEGLTLADLNAPDFVVIDAPPCLRLAPGQTLEVSTRVSHFSDATAPAPVLRWRQEWLDVSGPTPPAEGHRVRGAWDSRPIDWKPFEVVDGPAVTVSAPAAGGPAVGALLVELIDPSSAGGSTADTPRVLARNYVNVWVEARLPRTEVPDDRSVVLRFDPGDFSEALWVGSPTATFSGMRPEKVFWGGAGKTTYRLELPEGLDFGRLDWLELRTEVSAKAGEEKLDWPAVRKPFDYPQTDGKKWPSEITVAFNGVEVARQVLDDDPADARGVLSHVERFHPGSYGRLLAVGIGRGDAGGLLGRVLAASAGSRTLTVCLAVPEDARHRGGLAIFGDRLGRFPLDPTLTLRFREPHGLRVSDPDRPVAVQRLIDRLMTLVTAAEAGRHSWQWTVQQPPDNWMQPDFDDAAWSTGQGGFGRKGTPNAVVRTFWTTPGIWLRTTFELPAGVRPSGGHWRLYHDEDVTVYLNGREVLKRAGHVSAYTDVLLDETALQVLVEGRNVVAVHCRQTEGDQYVDLGLVALNE